MKTIVLDTDVLIDYVKRYAPWIDLLASNGKASRLILPTIVIAEYFAAVSLASRVAQESADETFTLFVKQPLDEPIAKVLGKLLRKKTYPAGADLADLIVASTAIYLDAPLATRNKNHFQGIPGLRFFKPKEIEIL